MFIHQRLRTGHESQCYGKAKFTALSNAAKKYMNVIARRYA
jgi:hypothetical protein